MKKYILISILITIFISCNTSENILGNWKSEKSNWKAKIIKEENKLYLIGGAIDRRDSKFLIKKNENSYSVIVSPLVFSLEYKDDKLYFNDKVWIRE